MHYENILDDAARQIAHASKGSRNNTLFRLATRVLRIVRDGHLDESRVLRELSAAAQTAGLEHAEVETTLRSAQDAALNSAPRHRHRTMPHSKPSRPTKASVQPAAWPEDAIQRISSGVQAFRQRTELPEVLIAHGFEQADLQHLEIFSQGEDVAIVVRNAHGHISAVKVRKNLPAASGKYHYLKQLNSFQIPSAQNRAWHSPGFGHDPSLPVLVIEGELNGIISSRVLEGRVDVIGMAGANGKTDWSVVASRRVAIYADGDNDGQNAANRWLKFARTGNARSVTMIPPWFDAAGQLIDACDIAATLGRDELFARLAPTLKALPDGYEASSGRRVIVVSGRQVPDMAAECSEVLSAGPHAYRRGKEIVLTSATHTLYPATEANLTSRLQAHADFVKEDGRPHLLHGRIVGHIIDELWPELPEVKHVIEAPGLLPDGTIPSRDGYYREHKTLVRKTDFVRTEFSVEEAKEFLEQHFVDFPFEHRASGLAAILSTLIGHLAMALIDGPRPMLVIDANGSGQGKTLIAQIISIILTGVDSVTKVPRRETELEKMIPSFLLHATPVVIFDNAVDLNLEPLKSLLTGVHVSTRLMGGNSLIEADNNTTWMSTGINLRLGAEMHRRAVPLRLVSGEDRSELKGDFKRKSIRRWTREHRSELLSAVAAIIENWLDAGKPEYSGHQKLGSYEDWVRVVGGILQAAGVEGFLEHREYMRHDPVAEGMALWLEQTHFLNPDPIKVLGASDFINATNGFESELTHLLNFDVRNSRRVGHFLKEHTDRTYRGFTLTEARTNSGNGNKGYHVQVAPR